MYYYEYYKIPYVSTAPLQLMVWLLLVSGISAAKTQQVRKGSLADGVAGEEDEDEEEEDHRSKVSQDSTER